MAVAKFDDARATWELLSANERAVLAVLARPSTWTPQGLMRPAGLTSWQQAAAIARQLKRLGLVRIISLPKQTSYELNGQGRACLEAGQQAVLPTGEGKQR